MRSTRIVLVYIHIPCYFQLWSKQANALFAIGLSGVGVVFIRVNKLCSRDSTEAIHPTLALS